MPTFRDLYDALGAMSPEQLDTEIRVIPNGYTDADASLILQYPNIPLVLEIAKATRNIYHCQPQDSEDDFMQAGTNDFSDDEVRDMGIDTDEDYKLVCPKGQVYLKIKDNIVFTESEDEHFRNLDSGIMPL